MYGTSLLNGSHFRSRGHVEHGQDPATGDIFTHVVPPPPPGNNEHGTIVIAPEIYPHMPGPQKYQPPMPGYYGPGFESTHGSDGWHRHHRHRVEAQGSSWGSNRFFDEQRGGW
ncbi:MAG: hypothetical protein J5861_08165 [Desulfovibrio sp.]|nr:hypothetical protein [Desulfovibrio sp.]